MRCGSRDNDDISYTIALMALIAFDSSGCRAIVSHVLACLFMLSTCICSMSIGLDQAWRISSVDVCHSAKRP